jgi:hypothetical protein
VHKIFVRKNLEPLRQTANHVTALANYSASPIPLTPLHMTQNASRIGSLGSNVTEMSGIDFLGPYDESGEEPDDLKVVLALVDHLRLGLQTPIPLPRKLQEIGRLLSILLDDEETAGSPTKFEKILYTRLDKLVEEVVAWKFNVRFIADHEEGGKVKIIFVADILPKADLLQLKWQLRLSESYFNIDTLRRQMLAIDGALRGIYLNTGQRINGYRWEVMEPNITAKQYVPPTIPFPFPDRVTTFKVSEVLGH